MGIKKILIVEDTKNIREIIAYMLKTRGYEVMEAEDGDVGYQLARTHKPDLIILDAMLPGKSGFDICSELKEDSGYSRIPIIILTAITRGTGKSDEFWKEKSKADDFISKPFKIQDLLERVNKLLARQT
jgi:two-component system phosphate regulon response regulator PhoB